MRQPAAWAPAPAPKPQTAFCSTCAAARCGPPCLSDCAATRVRRGQARAWGVAADLPGVLIPPNAAVRTPVLACHVHGDGNPLMVWRLVACLASLPPNPCIAHCCELRAGRCPRCSAAGLHPGAGAAGGGHVGLRREADAVPAHGPHTGGWVGGCATLGQRASGRAPASSSSAVCVCSLAGRAVPTCPSPHVLRHSASAEDKVRGGSPPLMVGSTSGWTFRRLQWRLECRRLRGGD